ncbi:MAG: hypothetical protein AAF639_42255 [Chloroflexota bacterium]
MNESNVTAYTPALKDLMRKKSYLLSKAQTLFEIGMAETAQPIFLSAAAYEEQIAVLLDTEKKDLEAAMHRISAASCYKKAGHLGRAISFYRAALSGPLNQDTRLDVLNMIDDCLEQFAQQPSLNTIFPMMIETTVTA